MKAGDHLQRVYQGFKPYKGDVQILDFAILDDVPTCFKPYKGDVQILYLVT